MAQAVGLYSEQRGIRSERGDYILRSMLLRSRIPFSFVLRSRIAF